MDWYAQTKLGLTRTLSEENVYEDILGKRPQRLCVGLNLSGRKGRENGAGCWKHTCRHSKTPVHWDERAGRWVGERTSRDMRETVGLEGEDWLVIRGQGGSVAAWRSKKRGA